MKIRTRDKDSSTFLHISGPVRGPSSTQLSKTLASLAETNSRRIVVDLTQVESIDSSGLGALIFCQKLLEESGKDMLVAAYEHTKKMLLSCNLEKILKILDPMELIVENSPLPPPPEREASRD